MLEEGFVFGVGGEVSSRDLIVERVYSEDEVRMFVFFENFCDNLGNM